MNKSKKRNTYNWKTIKAYYEELVKMNETNINPKVCKKFNIPTSTLSDKIKRDGWILTESQNKAIKGLRVALTDVTTEITDATELQEHLINEKIQNELKLSGLSSSSIGLMQDSLLLANRNIKEALEDEEKKLKPHELSQYMKMGKDGYTTANPPKPNQVNVQQNTNVVIPTIADMYDDQGKLCP